MEHRIKPVKNHYGGMCVSFTYFEDDEEYGAMLWPCTDLVGGYGCSQDQALIDLLGKLGAV